MSGKRERRQDRLVASQQDKDLCLMQLTFDHTKTGFVSTLAASSRSNKNPWKDLPFQTPSQTRMAKVRHSRLQAKKWSTVTLVLSMSIMLTVVLLMHLGLGIFSLPINNDDSSPNDLTSYRRMSSETERGNGLGKRGEQWTEVLSWEPRASLYHNFLSKEECEYLIKLAKPHMAKSTVVDNETGRSKDSRVRTSSGTFLKRGQDRIVRDIEKRIADYSFIPVEHGEGLQILRYEVGQKYDAHFDYFNDEFNIKNGGQRMATMLMYLSDVEEGGETIFPAAKGNISAVPYWNELSECGKQGLAVKPNMGDALLFWSMKPDATLDPSSLHAGSGIGNSETHILQLHAEGLSVKMSQDVEMKDSETLVSSADSSAGPSALGRLRELVSLIKFASYNDEVRLIDRAVRNTFGLRPLLTAPVLSSLLDFAFRPGSEAHSRLSSFLPEEDEHGMDVDTETSAGLAPTKHLLPEVEIYCSLLVLLFLIDQKKYDEAKACSSSSINRLKSLNRTVGILVSKLYFYYSYSYELTGDLAKIRGNLLALHRTATRYHDELSQETLLNLLLRNYLHYNLYDQAEKLRSKTPRFEVRSIQQSCRYLFYLGKIRTIQLDYTDAKKSLLKADHLAPVAARGFRIQCNKWAILVRLLLGEIPERTIFAQKGMKKALRPYFELTNAVRIADLELFQSVAEKFTSTFSTDKTQNLIVRLRHNVIRGGLRNISISYSRISLADVAEKLRLTSETPVADAESIAAKAIRDGAIDATLDHANGWMVSREIGDIYSTNKPQAAFHSRITFCLNMHNEAVRAMYFPPNTFETKEGAEKRRERLQLADELAHQIADDEADSGYF
ncbi:hypothetical protein V6N13_012337 [Hibiscus sabdariffa]